MNTHRYLEPNYKIVKKKRAQKKVLGALLILIICIIIIFGLGLYVNAEGKTKATEISSKIRPGLEHVSNNIINLSAKFNNCSNFCLMSRSLFMMDSKKVPFVSWTSL